jgi:hypothetical protein
LVENFNILFIDPLMAEFAESAGHFLDSAQSLIALTDRLRLHIRFWLSSSAFLINQAMPFIRPQM